MTESEGVGDGEVGEEPLQEGSVCIQLDLACSSTSEERGAGEGRWSAQLMSGSGDCWSFLLLHTHQDSQ